MVCRNARLKTVKKHCTMPEKIDIANILFLDIETVSSKPEFENLGEDFPGIVEDQSPATGAIPTRKSRLCSPVQRTRRHFRRVWQDRLHLRRRRLPG